MFTCMCMRTYLLLSQLWQSTYSRSYHDHVLWVLSAGTSQESQPHFRQPGNAEFCSGVVARTVAITDLSALILDPSTRPGATIKTIESLYRM
jgi:hypothetical protein